MYIYLYSYIYSYIHIFLYACIHLHMYIIIITYINLHWGPAAEGGAPKYVYIDVFSSICIYTLATSILRANDRYPSVCVCPAVAIWAQLAQSPVE